jgi:predicted enzyme related to lactoylglutathione lyase
VTAAPDPAWRSGKICYLELAANDVATSAAFYRDVFGWRIRRRGDGAVAFDDAVEGVSGTFVTDRSPATAPGLLLYIMVADAAAVLASVVAGGGRVVQGIPHEDGEVFAWFADPAGNVLGIYQQPGLAGAEASR